MGDINVKGAPGHATHGKSRFEISSDFIKLLVENGAELAEGPGVLWRAENGNARCWCARVAFGNPISKLLMSNAFFNLISILITFNANVCPISFSLLCFSLTHTHTHTLSLSLPFSIPLSLSFSSFSLCVCVCVCVCVCG